MSLESKTKGILDKYNLRAKKYFGQNFLVNETIIDNIVKAANLTEGDLVIEIGPGIGSLTEKLIQTQAQVLAFEIDSQMIQVLQDRFDSNENFKLVNNDVLKEDINRYVEEYNVRGKIKVVANLPYYITTPILFKILGETEKISEVIVMVQKEVADRIVASEGNKDYGVLTVNTNYYGVPSKLFDVPRESFMPPPNVTSSIVKIDVIKRYSVCNEKLFFELIKCAFAQRRKKLLNSLVNNKFNNMNKNEIQMLLDRIGAGENARAEEIPVEKYIEMVNSIKE